MHRYTGYYATGDDQTCWPRSAEICEKLTLEPFAPEVVMRPRQLMGKGLAWPSGRQTLTTSLDRGCMTPVDMASCLGPASLLARYRIAKAFCTPDRAFDHASACRIHHSF